MKTVRAGLPFLALTVHAEKITERRDQAIGRIVMSIESGGSLKGNDADSGLMAAVRRVRSGTLDADQCEALAALLIIAGNTTLPTPVAAAVFNVVAACGRGHEGNK
jgi:hypothetical protein